MPYYSRAEESGKRAMLSRVSPVRIVLADRNSRSWEVIYRESEAA